MASTSTAHNDEYNCIGWAVHDSSGTMSLHKFNRRDVGVLDVSINIMYCGFCDIDLAFTKNITNKTMYPLIPGHEIVGVVNHVGSDVQRFTVGDHVAVGLYVDSCKQCECCIRGSEVNCTYLLLTFNAIDCNGVTTMGGLSRHIVVNERYCYRVPESMPLSSAPPLLCSGINA